jgi:hypothetical protein
MHEIEPSFYIAFECYQQDRRNSLPKFEPWGDAVFPLRLEARPLHAYDELSGEPLLAVFTIPLGSKAWYFLDYT